MSKGLKYQTNAFSMLDHIEIKTVPLSEEENNERIKRLAKKILRIVEVSRRRKKQRDDDFKQVSLETELAI